VTSSLHWVLLPIGGIGLSYQVNQSQGSRHIGEWSLPPWLATIGQACQQPLGVVGTPAVVAAGGRKAAVGANARV
jgi:hypothetical protein